MFETLVKMRRPLQQCAASSHTPLRTAMVSAGCFPHTSRN
jgi:hypothetical protein